LYVVAGDSFIAHDLFPKELGFTRAVSLYHIYDGIILILQKIHPVLISDNFSSKKLLTDK